MTENETMSSNSLLRAANISKFYDGVCALKDVSVAVSAGEVHALVGENGAGKSTLIKILTGAVAADSGQVILNGKVIAENSPRLAKLLGIEVIYQQPTVFRGLTSQRILPSDWRDRECGHGSTGKHGIAGRVSCWRKSVRTSIQKPTPAS